MKINHWNRFVRTGVARFLLPKTEKMYQININCTEWTEHIPNARKILQMAIKYRWTFSNQRPSKIYPNWDFWFKSKPSGNPIENASEKSIEIRVTRSACEKIAQNLTQPKMNTITCTVEKSAPRLWATYFCNFQRASQNKQYAKIRPIWSPCSR
jgi:hypothetical protein